ncbi:hypothetical protein BGZ94_010394 [Podila epigama]|nr:hypothetical protein BGZ94_010394 [Podila epigama]
MSSSQTFTQSETQACTSILSKQNTTKPTVLISGGGLAGLTLAILLHKANIPFAVFERAREIKPLGSFISLGASVGPLFKQLGIHDEFAAMGKHYTDNQMYTEDLKPLFLFSFEYVEALGGYKQYMVSRPDLYDLLLRQIPPERVFIGKRILSYKETDDGVVVHCSDNSQYKGDILVGADGAYSAVRQQMYKELKKANRLPPCDDVTLPYSCACLVGQTEVLDPKEFPALAKERCDGNVVLGRDSQCTWITTTTKKNTVCWMVIQFLNKDTYKDNDTFRTSEWGPEAAEAFANEVKSFKVPGLRNGQPMTLGDYVDRTPLNNISKVMLEEIVFKTWHSRRAVLIGDACHKMNPSGALGAAHAMLDAVTLANWLSTLNDPTVEQMDTVFRHYRNERHPVAKDAFVSSQKFRMTLGKDLPSKMTRTFMRRMPLWMWRMMYKKIISVRHQASFLPLVEENAKVKASYQPSLHQTLQIHKENDKKTKAQAKANVDSGAELEP